MIPTLIEQMLYLGISFANQWSIFLRSCYPTPNCYRNIIIAQLVYQKRFLTMKT